MTEQPAIFWVSNKHSKAMGEPPHIDGSDPNKYFGYFENELREQFVFVFDYPTQTGMLWVGDAGWGRAYQVIDGKASELNLTLNESMWVRLCWETVISVLPK